MRLTPVDLMYQHVDTKSRHALEQQEIQFVLELRLKQVLHPDLFSTHHSRQCRARRSIGNGHRGGGELEREYSHLVRGYNYVNVAEYVWGQLVDAEEYTWIMHQQWSLREKSSFCEGWSSSPLEYRSAAVYLYDPNLASLPDFASAR
jgi:hypothetical protein